MRVTNLAHGAFAMIGGYIASYAARDLGLGYGVAVLLAVAGTVAIAIPIERLLYRRIYGAPVLTQVLMTIGITFCIIGIANYVFGPTLKTIPLPQTLRTPVDLGFRTIGAQRVFAIVSGLAVAAALWFVIDRTRFGVKLRASVDNAAMAALWGCGRNWSTRSASRRRSGWRPLAGCGRGAAADRALLCPALHGDVPGGGVHWWSRLDPRRTGGLPAAQRHRHHGPIPQSRIW